MTATFRTMRKPVKPGELRAKSWQYLLEPKGEDDPLWAHRCKAYWAVQERLFGFKVADRVTFVIDWENRIVTTFAVVERVLDGRRDPHFTLSSQQRAAISSSVT